MTALRRRILLAAIAALMLVLVLPLAALAHPMGNFSINHFSSITVRGSEVRILYVVDFAEIPTFQELSGLNVSSGDALSAAKRAAYLKRQATSLSAGLTLTEGGAPVRLQRAADDLIFPPGAGNLSTERVYVVLNGTLPHGSGTLSYVDNNFPGRAGWKEIVVKSGGGVTITHSSAPAESRSQSLTIYPTSLTSSAPQDVTATFTVATSKIMPAGTILSAKQAIRQAEAPLLNPDGTWSALAQQLTVAGKPRSFSSNRNDPLTNLMKGHQITVGFLLLSLVVAFWFGAGHALSPGHGKTMVGAYLVGSRGTPWQALVLGLTVTATHTAGVYALGLVTLYFSQYILPDQLYPVLGFISGMLVAAMGATLAYRRFMRLRRSPAPRTALAQSFPAAPSRAQTGISLLPAGALSISSVQTLPMHSHGTHGDVHSHDHQGAHTHDHAHNENVPHRHGPFGRAHTHAPLPGADGEPIRLRNLIALGVSGGLLPCPSALVVLLSAIAFHRVIFGMVLIVAFSLGLATVLTGIGIAVVYSGRYLNRLPFANRGGAVGRLRAASRALPVFSSLVVAVLGMLIAIAALNPSALPGFLSSL